jgi:predicted TPR repeat methyltransferase
MTIEEIFAAASRAHQAGDERQAGSLYENVLRQDPNHFGALFGLGLLSIRAGKFELAASHLRDAVAVDPRSASGFMNLAGALASMGRFDDAIHAYRQVVRLEPDNAAAFNNLGALFASRRQMAEAESCFRKAVELQPDYFKALFNLANFLAVPAHYSEATAYTQRALKQKPDDQVMSYLLAALTGERQPSATPLDYVRSLFDNSAPSFDADLAGMSYRAPEMMRGLISPPAEPKSLDIVDLGCGTGLSGVPFAEMARTLVGVDLSPPMLEVAGMRGIYTRLVQGELLEVLAAPEQYDLILSADVFIYVGDLASVFAAVRRSLRPNGRFVFAVESHSGTGYALQPTRRYAHSVDYIRTLAVQTGLCEIAMTSGLLRTEFGVNIDGYSFVLRNRRSSEE